MSSLHSLGTGGGWTPTERAVVHFGSPEGSTNFGDETKRLEETFKRDHPDFILDDKDAK